MALLGTKIGRNFIIHHEMKIETGSRILEINNLKTQQTDQFELDVLFGLSQKHKFLPSKYFYDTKGSELFQQITELPEYYLTGSEFEILEKYKSAISQHVKQSFNFVEFGSGDGRKTKVLLKYFVEKQLDFEYFPLDISRDALNEVLKSVQSDLPGVKATGLCGEYFDGMKKLAEFNEKTNFILFLGSNIGNFNNGEIRKFMTGLWDALSHGDLILMGFDLVKDEKVLLNAYFDSLGITTAFNMNLLTRINRELQADFNLDQFRHYAYYDPEHFVMKSYLVSTVDQEVSVKKLRKKFHFKKMEPIFMENSFKFSNRKIEKIAKKGGFEILEVYKDSKDYFADVMMRCVKQ